MTTTATDETSAPRLLDPDEVATLLGVTKTLLSRWRSEGRGPKYLKLGAKSIRYDRRDLDAWIEAEKVDPKGTDEPEVTDEPEPDSPVDFSDSEG